MKAARGPGGVELSRDEARRIALAAQGFAKPRPVKSTRRHIRGVFDSVAVIQIDSVNVLVRSQYLPPFSRIGAYDRATLDRMAYVDRELFEFWGHEASLMPVRLYPLMRWKMERARTGETSDRIQQLMRERPGYVEAVLAEVAERGPVSARELSDPGERRGPWWGWADGKRALEILFWTGQVAVARRRNFERLYDLPERVLPAEVLGDAPSEEEGRRELLLIAARCLGVATAADVADYFRLRLSRSKASIERLVEDGLLVRARVEGWPQQAYLPDGARTPRRLEATALLSPFDSLVWFRERASRLFDFDYRIEIYTPAARRRFGYYVLPFLMGGRIAARVDLKADRRTGTLLVPSLHPEPGVAPIDVVAALAPELRTMAEWLGLDSIAVGARSRAAVELRRAIRVQ